MLPCDVCFCIPILTLISGWIFREYMKTSSNGNIFRVTGHLCGEFTGPRWIPRTKANDAELWCFFYLRLNKRLSKQSWGWWFETLSRSLWRHRNDSMCLWLHQGLSLSSNQLCPSDKVFQDDFVWIKSCLSHFILKLCANVFGDGIYSVECCIKDSPKMLSRFWWIW